MSFRHYVLAGFPMAEGKTTNGYGIHPHRKVGLKFC